MSEPTLVQSNKRKLSLAVIPERNSSDDASTNSVSQGLEMTMSLATRPTVTSWGFPSATTSGFFSRRSASIPEFKGFGSSVSPPSKRARISTSSPSPGDIQSDQTPFGEEGPVPAVHHMFDVTGRVPPPPRPTHSDSEDESDDKSTSSYTDEDGEDADRSEGPSQSATNKRASSNSSSPKDVFRNKDPSNSESLLEVESSPHASNQSSTPRLSTRSLSHRSAPPAPLQATSLNNRDRPKMAISNLMSPHDTSDEDMSQKSRPDSRTSHPDTHHRLGGHVLTLYLEDKRPAEPDLQMAEITITLTRDENVSLWNASSQDLITQLQGGPSRIDGSAKLFYLRKESGTGKLWKQCILRMSDSEFLPSNGRIQVPDSLEINLLIEKNPTLRLEGNNSHSGSPTTLPTMANQKATSTPRVRSDGRVAIPPTPVSLRSIPKQSLIPGLEKLRDRTNPHPNAHWPKPKGSGSETSAILPSQTEMVPENRSSRTRKAMADYIRPLILAEPYWPSFHDTKGHVKSNAEALKSLRFFEDMVTKYVNQTVPPHIPYIGGKRITKAGLLEAVGRGTTWGSDCHIVLGLVERFGPGGPDENQEVVELLQKPPGDKKGGIAEFVSRMKRIRDEYDKRRESEANDSPTQPGDR